MTDNQVTLHDQLANLLAPEMVMKYSCVVEVLDENGSRFLRFITSTGLTAWDSKGLLREALDFEIARTMSMYMNMGEDDE